MCCREGVGPRANGFGAEAEEVRAEILTEHVCGLLAAGVQQSPQTQ